MLQMLAMILRLLSIVSMDSWSCDALANMRGASPTTVAEAEGVGCSTVDMFLSRNAFFPREY